MAAGDRTDNFGQVDHGNSSTEPLGDSKKKHRLSKKARWWILGTLLVVFTLSTLAGVPLGTKAQPEVAITQPYVSIRAQMIKQDPERVVPNNIYNTAVVPSNSTFYQLENLDQGNGQFDRSVSYLSPLTTSQLDLFASSFIAHFGWKLMTFTKNGSTHSYYLQKAGQDGNVWEMLFQISPPPANLTTLNSNISNVITERILITSFQ
ncbi:MAG: hypothetical protein M0T78_00460 [Actinomycetota bacterium]|jgi:hypothetical protein|nr:hypothetical protein [Actinomycetota bacterium]